MELVLQDSKNIIDISENIFGLEFNESLVHQVVVAYIAGSRQGTRAQKTRAEVTGSGKKPWRQKGTGRARAGSIKSPIWRSGGVTFAAKPQNYSQKINKKMYRGALKSIFSELLRQNRLIIVENFIIPEPKTKILANKLKKNNLGKILIIIDKINKKLILASQNLYKVYVCLTKNIDPVSLISFDKVIITAKAVKQIEDMLL